jgi:hypothetical protein
MNMEKLIAILTTAIMVTIIVSAAQTGAVTVAELNWSEQLISRAPAVVECMTDMECATLNPELEF